LLAGLLEAAGEVFAVPVMSGVAGLHRFAVLVEQAEVEVEAVGLMPAERPGRTGKTTADRAGGIEADQIQTFGRLGDLRHDLLGVRQRMLLHTLALPAVVVEQQVRILRQQRQGFTQLLQAFGKALQVGFLIAGQGDLQIGMATVVDQFQTDTGLLNLPGLTHLGVVETDEGRRFGVVTQGELFRLAHGIAQPVDQQLERLGLALGNTHQASPPNTSTLLNTQAGEAWPTRITWFGSPLPQFGVPSTWVVAALPTARRLFQKCAEMPR